MCYEKKSPKFKTKKNIESFKKDKNKFGFNLIV